MGGEMSFFCKQSRAEQSKDVLSARALATELMPYITTRPVGRAGVLVSGFLLLLLDFFFRFGGWMDGRLLRLALCALYGKKLADVCLPAAMRDICVCVCVWMA